MESRGVIITGGSTGIGFSTAERFAKNGDSVLITARTQSDLDTAQTKLESQGLQISTIAADVSDLSDTDRVVDFALSEFVHIDVLINNAGICYEASVLDTPDNVWDDLMNTNLTGVFIMSRAAARAMIDKGTEGVIINTSSINSRLVEELYVPYSATKAAVDALTEGLAVELAPYGIRVCSVRPGYIETPMLNKVLTETDSQNSWRAEVAESVPLKRLADPSELAGVYLFLASSDASYITGTSIAVDGGRLAT